MDSKKTSKAIEGIGQESIDRSESPVIRGKTASESPVYPKSLPPVTPGVRDTGHSAYIETPSGEETPTGLSAESDGYFAVYNTARSDSPSAASAAAAGARSPEELLDKLSLSKTQTSQGDARQSDPRVAHPNLNLSGGIISATFVVPFAVKSIKDSGWVCS